MKGSLLIGIISMALPASLAAGHISCTAAMAEQELIVSAASSLTNAFGELGKRFERGNPGVKVIFNFGASGALLQQIDKGAPVDVLVSADQKTMDQAKEKNPILVDTRKDFVSNGLVLVTPKKPRFSIKGVKELARPGIARIALGNPETVPAGRYAKEVLTSQGLWETLNPKLIYGETVRQVLDYVSRGEVDAGFVFATDAIIAKERVQVAAAAEGHNPILYPVAVTTGTKKKDLSRGFIDFLLGSESQATLSRYGFGRTGNAH